MPQAEFMLFAGSSHRVLAQQIAEILGQQLGRVQIDAFPDTEIGVQILENVRGRDVFVLQTIARHPNLYLMELFILIDALKRASARSIAAVIPYFGYARQDRKDKGRVPITAKLVANLLEKAGVARVLTMDLHAEQVQGFFDVPVDNLYARPLLVEAVGKLGLKNPMVVAPDIGSLRLARSFAIAMNTDYGIIDKRRINAKQVEPNVLIGNVSGRDVVLVDDIWSTGETLKAASRVCKKAGAARIFGAVTHGLMTGPMAGRAFEESAIEKMLITNTVPLPEGGQPSRVETVSVASLFAKAIQSIVGDQSISSLFL